MAVLGHEECDKLTVTATAFLKYCKSAQHQLLQQNLPLMLARDKLRLFRLHRAKKKLRDEAEAARKTEEEKTAQAEALLPAHVSL